MRAAGARTFAQDEESSVVFGMPKEAFALGGVEKLVHIDDMPDTITRAVKDMQ
jgi:two-component system chemotaxis response regulator CheB